MPTKRCPNGTRKNKKTGNCEPTKTKSSPKRENTKASSVKNITVKSQKTPKISKKEQQQNIKFSKFTKDLTNIKSNYFHKKSGYDKFNTDIKNLIKDYTEAHKNNKINDKQFNVLELDTTITIFNVNDMNDTRKESEY